ncbi:hypothetical protein jhhlp_005202 [Lomentospora prolificans]|uniref:Hemerythrin-like domain-containing protein n=1 Tax=Lomentospora prolificans TaxID=41688 RepID=A0A2N3N742_9PEZI|nr:hypothetical protein jhhlp_005202 [Lomentospora prolificans]
MFNRGVQLLVAALAVLLGVIFTRAPFMMASQPPSDKPWADGPMKLVQTPLYLSTQRDATPKKDIFTTGASHMALLHNCIIRGFNSIWLQAPYIKEADKADFIGYSLTWFKFVKSHHDDEEDNLFSKVADILGDESVWSQTHEEHESFLGGLGEFNTYLTSLKSPSDFSGTELRRIMASFHEPFENHFHSEITTIADMADHPKAPKAGSPEEAAASTMFKTWGKTTVSKAGVWDVVPFFLLNLDRSAEAPLWTNWPPMPGPIKWGMVNIAGSWYSSWWKFSSCDANQRPKELYALEGVENKL